LEKKKEPTIMASGDATPIVTSVEVGKDPIVTSHPYFMKNVTETFLDEDAAVNINNSEMASTPSEYE